MGCTLCNLEEEMNAINLLVAKGDNLFPDRNEPSVAHLMTKLATLMVAKRRLEKFGLPEKKSRTCGSWAEGCDCGGRALDGTIEV